MNIFPNGFVKLAITECNGELYPLEVPIEILDHYGCTCVMNPSVYNDRGTIKCILRGVNYFLWHSANNQFSCWGGAPLQYIHPQDDCNLKTENFFLTFSEDLSNYTIKHIDMLQLHKPIWEFHGLEDARLFRWNGKLYACGVRRDTTTNGQGRMELSEIVEEEYRVKEVSRKRIPTTDEQNSYCEKNWVPILDRPYTFVRWLSPTQLIEYNPNTNAISEENIDESRYDTVFQPRGGSQVIKYKNYYICLGHATKFWRMKYGEKDVEYSSYFALFDENMRLIKITDTFKFFDNPVEFCCGLCMYGDNEMLATFGLCDNAAFMVRFNADWLIEKILNTNE